MPSSTVSAATPPTAEAAGTVPPDDAGAPLPTASVPVRRERAAKLLLRGKAQEAASLYAEILAADPADTASMEGRVRALIAAGSWRRALGEARGFASARPTASSLQT